MDAYRDHRYVASRRHAQVQAFMRFASGQGRCSFIREICLIASVYDSKTVYALINEYALNNAKIWY